MPIAHSASAIEHTRETPVVQAVRKISPAVVNIGAAYEVHYRANPFFGLRRNPFFDSFFRDFFDQGFERSQKRTSLGSGVVIDGKKGFILTNAHVLAQTGTITVTLKDEREFEARIVGADPDSDLAVLRIDSSAPLPAAEMGGSEDLMIGETVIAIGNPFGFSHTVTTGVVSAVNRSIRTEDRIYQNFIQIDASINPGNSGGPLLNINGELIGINTAIYAKAQGIGFAIPIDTAKKIVSDLIKFGEVVPAWLGISVQELDLNLARYLKVTEKPGVLVRATESGGPAHNAGIRSGDILLSIGNQAISTVEEYQMAMRSYAEGDRLTICLWRNNGELERKVTAAVFPEARAMDLAFKILGIRVESVSGGPRPGSRRSSKNTGVVITQVHPDSHLGRIGVVPGDLIRQIDEMTIETVGDFKKAIIKYRQKHTIVVLLFRGDQGYHITVKRS